MDTFISIFHSSICPPQPKGAYEINVRLIEILEREDFAGDPEKVPYKYIDNLTMLCSTVKLDAWMDDELKVKLFPFLLKVKAKDWLCSKPAGYFKSYKCISDAFLQYYFPQKKIYKRRFDIMTFKQSNNENLVPAYGRFLKAHLIICLIVYCCIYFMEV
jgi:hypothetical protein